jgi:CheY-like chemotaxis protein
VLCVEDEATVLRALKRVLSSKYRVDTASSGSEGLELLSRKPYAVIVSDLRMPNMAGEEFLRRARSLAPASARMLVTGEADLNGVVAAVNAGHVFRLLLKPLATEELASAVSAAVTHHYTLADQERLNDTLRTSTTLLTGLATLVGAEVSARIQRARAAARNLARLCGLEDCSALDLAVFVALLAQVRLPASAVQTGLRHKAGWPAETESMRRCLEVADGLISHLPDMSTVRRLMLATGYRVVMSIDPWDPGPPCAGAPAVLQLILSFDLLAARCGDPRVTLAVLRAKSSCPAGWIDTHGASYCGVSTEREELLRLEQLGPGMRLLGDVTGKQSGRVLLQNGLQLTRPMLERLKNHARHGGVHQPIKVGRPGG